MGNQGDRKCGDVLNSYFENEAVINDTNIADENDNRYVDIDNYGNFERINKRKRNHRLNYEESPKQAMHGRNFNDQSVSQIYNGREDAHAHLCVDVKRTKRNRHIRIMNPSYHTKINF